MAGKDQALSRAGLLYPKAKRVRSPLFKRLPFFDSRDKLQVKYEMLRSHEVDGLSVTEAADQFAYTRQGFYQVQRAFEEEGMAGLIEKKRGRRGAGQVHARSVEIRAGEKTGRSRTDRPGFDGAVARATGGRSPPAHDRKDRFRFSPAAS